MAVFTSRRSAAATLRRHQSKIDDVARNMLALAVMMAAEDGPVDKFVQYGLWQMIAGGPIAQALGEAHGLGLLDDLAHEVEVFDRDRLVARVNATLTTPQRETALLLAMRVALSDGYLTDRGLQMLRAMAVRLQISTARFDMMLDVISTLQRPAAA